MNLKYKIGEYIKINPTHYAQVWYTEQILKINGYGKNIRGADVYIIDIDLDVYDRSIKNVLFPSLVIQDKECIRKNRKEKLENLLNE